ncbi:MAG: hypothetical protein JXR41_11105 [Bacteroidales bacterium]|nr:hypothetical protein [Bacteroidales bacterium]MBN2763630.1 hypothetical protein [Bacteroidales bacterium]
MKSRLLFFPFMVIFLFACDNYDDISTVQSESFIKHYALNQVNEAVGICPLSDGGYALLGNTETITRGTDICLILTDKYGNSVQETKLYGSTGNDHGHCIKQAPDGGFIILGSKQKETGNDKDVFLIRTDRLGDTVWTRTYPYNNEDDEGYWFDTNDNGDIMMVGYCTKSTGRLPWQYLVDANGLQIDSYIPITTGGGDEARYVQRINDGWLITGIISPSHEYPVWMITNDYRFMLCYVPDSGTHHISENPASIVILNDNTAFVCGTVNTGADGSDVFLYKIKGEYNNEGNLEFNHEWSKVYNNAGDDKGTCILTDNNTIHVLSTRSSGEKTSTISIITTNMQGENPQYNSFGGSSRMESRTFEFTEDGGFIISGCNRRDDNSSMIMIKTKTEGVL